jgi:hypothetical protein
MKRVVAYVPDLMDRSRISAAAGGAVTFVATPSDLVGAAVDTDLVIVDLGRPGVLERLADLSTRTVGFASHVDRDLMAAAREAGCDQILARSAFFSRLRELVG